MNRTAGEALGAAARIGHVPPTDSELDMPDNMNNGEQQGGFVGR